MRPDGHAVLHFTRPSMPGETQRVGRAARTPGPRGPGRSGLSLRAGTAATGLAQDLKTPASLHSGDNLGIVPAANHHPASRPELLQERVRRRLPSIQVKGLPSYVLFLVLQSRDGLPLGVRHASACAFLWPAKEIP